LLASHLAGSTKKRTITSHRDNKVGLKLASIEDANALNRQSLSCGKEGIKLALNAHISLSGSKACQQFLDGHRLLWLVEITKDGET
jgi:hypothetical protein